MLLLLGWRSRGIGGDSSRRVDGVLGRLHWGRVPGEVSDVDGRELLLPGLSNVSIIYQQVMDE